MPFMNQDLRAFVASHVDEAVKEFLQDLDALSHEDLGKSWGAGSRCAYDFAYEVAIINRRVADRLRGVDPGPMPWAFGKEWLKAPTEYRDKDKVGELLATGKQAILDALGEDPSRPVAVGESVQPAYQLALFAAYHTTYHDAQLNFIQQLAGDMAVHWDG